MGILDGLTGKLEQLTEETKQKLDERDKLGWEYYVINDQPPRPQVLQQNLDLLGVQRWELVTVTPRGVFIFKRPRLKDDNADTQNQ